MQSANTEAKTKQGAHPRGGRRARARARRLEAFTDAALELIEHEGLERFTIARLAQRMDVALGALYRYFPSKQALVQALQERELARLGDEIAAERARCERVAAARALEAPCAALLAILALARLYRRFAARTPERFGLLSRVLASPQPVLPDREAAEVVSAAQPVWAQVAAVFEHAARVGALEPGHGLERALVLWTGLHGVLQLRKLERLGDAAPRTAPLADALVHTLLKGWGASADALARAASALDALGARQARPAPAGGGPGRRTTERGRSEG